MVSAQIFRIEDFQEQVSDWLWGTDRRGNLVYSNKRLDDYLLPPDGSFLGQNIVEISRALVPELTPGADAPAENLQRSIDKRQEFSGVVIRFFSEDGQDMHLVLKGRPHFNEKREFQGYCGVGKIDLKPEDEQDSVVNLDAFMMAVENSANGVVITDENGVIRYANPGSCEITGYSRAECYGKTPRLFRSGHTSLAVYSNFWTTLLQGNTWRGTVYNKHKNGEFFWCREVVSPIVRQDGTISNFIAVQEDVTFRLIAEEELKKSEERFKGFAEATTDWYWETDSNFRISYISDATHKYIRVKLEDLFLKSFGDEADPDAVPDVSFSLSANLAERNSFKDFTYAFTRKNGQACRWRISGEPCFASDGEFTGYHGIGKDITSWTELEEKLIQSRKMEEVGQRAGGLAHDFNNLLGIIMGNAELLKEKNENADLGEDPNLENILYATKRGINISNQLLVFSRKQNLNPELVNLSQKIQQMMEILRSSVGADIEIKLDIAEDLWLCYADADHFVNAILNLSINSRDAMNDTGVLRIFMENQTIEHDLSAKDIAKGEYVVVTVADEGEGIAQENLQKVFEPFYSGKGQEKGTGLGLSMVYGFAKKSGGAIWIESKVGEGTKVHLYLPRFNGQVTRLSQKMLSACT